MVEIKRFFLGLSLLMLSFSYAQKSKENNLLADGNEFQKNEVYPKAEATYRKALSLNTQNVKGHHNLGNALYRSKDYEQANQRFFQTQKNSTQKLEKHLAFHNMGNSYMQQKDYQKAVAAYMNALRNNPEDDQTRYNYALAKELLKKEQENQDQQDQKDNQDQQDQQDQEKDQEKNKDESEGDQKEKPSDDGEEGEEKENKEEKEEKKEKDGEKDKKDQNKKPEENKKPKPRKPGQLSPEQVKSLLEAMNQQEKGVQDKVNAKKVKGIPVKTKKDW